MAGKQIFPKMEGKLELFFACSIRGGIKRLDLVVVEQLFIYVYQRKLRRVENLLSNFGTSFKLYP